MNAPTPDRFLIPLVHLSSRPSTPPPSHSAPTLSGLHFSSGAKNKPLFHHYNHLLVNNSLFLSLSSLFPQRASSSHTTSSPHNTGPIPSHLPKDFVPTVPPATSHSLYWSTQASTCKHSPCGPHSLPASSFLCNHSQPTSQERGPHTNCFLTSHSFFHTLPNLPCPPFPSSKVRPPRYESEYTSSKHIWTFPPSGGFPPLFSWQHKNRFPLTCLILFSFMRAPLPLQDPKCWHSSGPASSSWLFSVYTFSSGDLNISGT